MVNDPSEGGSQVAIREGAAPGEKVLVVLHGGRRLHLWSKEEEQDSSAGRQTWARMPGRWERGRKGALDSPGHGLFSSRHAGLQLPLHQLL